MSQRPQPPVLWEPDGDRRERANITAFARWVRDTRGAKGVDADDYDSLWRWSVTDLDGFWAAVWDYFGVRADTPYEQVLADREMPGATWFPGATLNYAGTSSTAATTTPWPSGTPPSCAYWGSGPGAS